MAKVVNITLPATGEWVDLNAASGTVVGTELTVQCTGTTWVRLQESTGEPSTTSEGKIITSLSDSSSEATVINSPLQLWGRTTVVGRTALVAVQPL